MATAQRLPSSKESYSKKYILDYIYIKIYNLRMAWDVILYEKFESEYESLPLRVQDKILSLAKLLIEFGHHLGRPYVDTLKGSKHTNMKELRFTIEDGVWRVAFAFDTKRQAVLLVAGNKISENERKFYKKLISIADERFTEWLEDIKGEVK